MGRRIVKKKTLKTTVKTVEIDGKKYIEYSSGSTMQDYQNAIMNCALNENNFHPTNAADSLKIGKSTMYRMLSSDSSDENSNNTKKE